jgi:hypothetical protein
MFHYDDGIHITPIGLAVDVRRRQGRGFVSHAHADHMARHARAFCTPATSALYQHRLGRRPVTELPFGEPLCWGDLQLSTAPAGHILGAAMLLVESANGRLLYTGDFKLRSSSTAAVAEPPAADVLIMESTVGTPRYRLPNREEVVDQLVEEVEAAWSRDETPVVYAYATGKAQEVTRLLTSRGISVMQQRMVYAISQVYQSVGCDLGSPELFDPQRLGRHVVIAPPRKQRGAYLELPPRKRTIALTGWALDHGAKYKLGVDVALPLSDHADYDELIECVERVAPRRVFCTHGPEAFVDDLRGRGWDAQPLESQTRQLEM